MGSLSAVIKKLPWLASAQKKTGKGQGERTRILVVGRGAKLPAAFYKTAPSSVKAKIRKKSSVSHWQTNTGKFWLLQLQMVESKDHYGRFSPSPYAMARDLMGTCFRQILNEDPKSIHVDHIGESEDEFVGLCVGMEMAHYQFKKVWPKSNPYQGSFKIKTSLKTGESLFKQACTLGEATNWARFLVDLPPNLLQPKDYADLLKDSFSKVAKTKVNVWNRARLQKEGMGLHLAVGQSAEQEPHMVHVQYRGGGNEAPIAFVGKGITFDSGGLDIKPASGMRLMKKDMGGSASVAGIAYWVTRSKLKLNCDFYFAIAENAIGKDSFRPSDVLTAHNSLTVEIHNTDAEGRLVMADSLSVASEKKPQLIIDIATLTGAIKFGLGSGVPGLFSNSDNLAETLMLSGQARGDLSWRMPLIPEEKGRLKSEVADVVNCTSGFGGAVTAALFLEMFVGNTPWAHFDIYGWVDSAKGAYASSGGSGQVVQSMAHFLEGQTS